MKKFEFKLADINNSDTRDYTRDLNRLGQEGWEAVAMDQYGQVLMQREIVVLRGRNRL